MFDVRWTDDATTELLRNWTDAHPEDRGLITEAVNRIDKSLTTSADSAGESRAGDFRILVTETISVQYRVWHDVRQAQVANVWRTFAVPLDRDHE